MGLAWDVVLDTVTIARWNAYEEDWADQPNVDDLACAYFGIKPKSAQEAEIGAAMGPADFLRFVKQTGGTKLGPEAA